ncbi:unnamed protein product [Cyclocybe aegerita]|uniref:Uncharacterized protein n=1 Tax=Cyclocybe aegerita TaxID=1973307 RepID=A0A8S0W4Z7_CYCAE|nr:unnamed protein product [Cyclocybe aegerita]
MSLARHVRGVPAPEGTLTLGITGSVHANQTILFIHELTEHHAGFADALPFQQIGSIYFANTKAGLPPDDIASYRVPGPTIIVDADHRRDYVTPWTQITAPSLREFWLAAIQHGDVTLGAFLDLAEALRVLIERMLSRFPPPEAHPELYAPYFVPADYVFRNNRVNLETRKIDKFLDWDDTCVMPFLLATRLPDDICEQDCALSENLHERRLGADGFPSLLTREGTLFRSNI